MAPSLVTLGRAHTYKDKSPRMTSAERHASCRTSLIGACEQAYSSTPSPGGTAGNDSRGRLPAISLVASTRGLALMPAYAKNLLPWSVVSRPLQGEAPTIDLAVGYSKSNDSQILELFLSRLGELRANTPEQKH